MEFLAAFQQQNFAALWLSVVMLNWLGCKPESVNLSGHAIALWHLCSGSGAKMVVALLQEMKQKGAKRELESLYFGFGQATAIWLEM